MQIVLKFNVSSIRRHRLPVPELFFLLVFSALLVIHCIENTSLVYSGYLWLDGMYSLRLLLYLAVLVKLIFYSSYHVNDLIALAVILLIAVISYSKCGDSDIFELFLLAAAAKDVNPRHIVTLFFVIKSCALLLTMVLWKCGILPTLYYDNGSSYYNTYGFCHRNVLGANIVVLCLAWFFLRYDRLKLRDVILWVAIALGVYRLVYSRSSIIIIILIAICTYLFRQTEDFIFRRRYMRTVFLCAMMMLILISLWWMLCYSSTSAFWQTLDSFFTTRIKSANYCYETYGLSLFGQEIPFVSSLQAQLLDITKLILDNAYARLFLYYGIVPAVVYFYLYFRMLGCAFDTKNGAILMSLFLFAVYGLSERYMLDAYYQFPFLIAFWYLKQPRINVPNRRKHSIRIPRVQFTARQSK